MELMQPSSIDVRLDRFFRLFDNHKYPYIDPREQQGRAAPRSPRPLDDELEIPAFLRRQAMAFEPHNMFSLFDLRRHDGRRPLEGSRGDARFHTGTIKREIGRSHAEKALFAGRRLSPHPHLRTKGLRDDEAAVLPDNPHR